MSVHIISAVVGYKPVQVGYFLVSLRVVHFEGVLHLITDVHDRMRFASVCKKLGLRCRVYGVRRPRNIWENRLCRALLAAPIPTDIISGFWANRVFRGIFEKALPVCCLRYFVARDIATQVLLAESGESVNHLLFTDSRDVYFQESPVRLADHVRRGQILLAIEPRYLSESDMNFKWLAELYGYSVATKWVGRSVSCSGTSFGDGVAMTRYLEGMVDQIVSRRSRLCHTVGYDQGVHNYLWYSGFLGEVVESHNNRGPIYTGWNVGVVNSDGKVVNESGDVVTIVHQFDRKIDRFEQLRFVAQLKAEIRALCDEVALDLM